MPFTGPPAHFGDTGRSDQPMATLAPGPSAPPVEQDAICAKPAFPSRLVPDTDSMRITLMHISADFRNSGRFSLSGTAGHVTGIKLAAASYRARRSSFCSLRCNCQTPSPIMVATAADTSIVGSTGHFIVCHPALLQPPCYDALLPTEHLWTRATCKQSSQS